MMVEKCEERAAFEEGENQMGYFVEREVFADVPLGSLPHEGAFGRVGINQEGPVALGGYVGGSVGN